MRTLRSAGRLAALSGLVATVAVALPASTAASATAEGNQYFLSNVLTSSTADVSFGYGRADDVVLVGDWNGDGIDTLTVRRGNTYYVSNTLGKSSADTVFSYGRADDVVLVGDWNGDGVDTLTVRRGNTYYVSNTLGKSSADTVFSYGRATDVVLVGDWDGNRSDTLGVRRSNTYYVSNTLTKSSADKVFSYGRATDVVLVGDWDGNRSDTLGVRRPAPEPAKIRGDGTFVVGRDVKAGLYKTSDTSALCYWERRSDTSGDFDGIIANDLRSSGPAYVHILSSDAAFTTDDCGTWTQVTASDPVSIVKLADGQYRVGIDVRPGTYRAYPADGCYWARLSGFTGTLDDVITNDYADGTVTVTISSSDVGFDSSGCGTWQKIG